jgi:hypothetical protein
VSGTRIFVVASGTTTAKVTITMTADATAPTAPAAFLAKATSMSEVALTWSAATDNRAVAGYRIRRDGALVATTASTTRSLADAGLTGGTLYAYVIRAFDGSGNEGPALTSSTTTKPTPDVTPPTQPATTITPENPSWADLAWTAAADARGVTSYKVLRDGALYFTTGGSTLHLRVPRGSSYRVIAVDAAGNASTPSVPLQA